MDADNKDLNVSRAIFLTYLPLEASGSHLCSLDHSSLLYLEASVPVFQISLYDTLLPSYIYKVDCYKTAHT